MQSIYCTKCHVLLMKADMLKAEIKCHKCKSIESIDFITQHELNILLTKAEKSVTIKS